MGLPKTNPSSGREQDLNPGPPDYKSSALTTRPHLPPNEMKAIEKHFHLVLFVMLYKVGLWMKPYCVIIQMKAIEHFM